MTRIEEIFDMRDALWFYSGGAMRLNSRLDSGRRWLDLEKMLADRGIPPAAYVFWLLERTSVQPSHAAKATCDSLRREFLAYWASLATDTEILTRCDREQYTTSPSGELEMLLDPDYPLHDVFKFDRLLFLASRSDCGDAGRMQSAIDAHSEGYAMCQLVGNPYWSRHLLHAAMEGPYHA